MSVLSSSAPLQTLLAQFQARYPRGSLIAELLTIHQHHYVVRAIVQLEGVVLTTGMAAAPDIEAAEDRAKYRALESLGLLTATSRTPAQSLSNPTSFNPDPVLPVSDPSFQSLKTLAAPEPVGTSATISLSDSTPLPPVTPTSFSTMADGTSLKQPFPEEESVPQATPSAFEHLPPPASEEPRLDANLPHLALNQSSLPNAQAAQANVSLETMHSGQKLKKSQPNVSSANPSDKVASPPTPADRSEEIAKIGFEMKRLGWSNEQGREYLKRTYGKRSRQELNDEELISFLQYLEAQPASLQTPF